MMPRCEHCGQRLRHNEGKICRVCQSRVMKQLRMLRKIRRERDNEKLAS